MKSYSTFLVSPTRFVSGVPADRQKIMAKGAWRGFLKDDTSLAELKDGDTVSG